VAKQALKWKAGLEAKVKYLQSQPSQLSREKRKSLRSSRSSSKQIYLNESEADESNSLGDSTDDVHTRRSRRHRRPNERSDNDFKVDIPEFEGQLDMDLFLDWL